jgi:hypothetical protein
VRIVRKRPAEAARQRTPFGFVQPQLETSEASISLVGLDPGATLAPASLAAEHALLLPLSARLESSRLFTPHEPVRLGSGEACTNRDALAALLVICAQRGSHA